MDFRLVVPPDTQLADIKGMIIKRHAKARQGKDTIKRMFFFHDDSQPEHQLGAESTTIGSINFARRGETGCYELLYDYYPHADPFEGRPFAAVLNSTNPELSLPVPQPLPMPAA